MPSLYSIHQAKALRLAAESEDWSKAMGTVRVLIIDGAAKVAGAPAGNVLDNTKYLYTKYLPHVRSTVGCIHDTFGSVQSSCVPILGAGLCRLQLMQKCSSTL